MENEKPSGDVIAENPPVNENPVPSEQETQVAESTESQEQDVQETDVETPKERPQQNVDSEWKRKFENMVTKLPELVGQEIQKYVPKSQEQKPQYTVEELRQYATDNPQYAGWAEKQILEINREETKKLLREEFQSQQKVVQSNLLRQQTEQAVLSNPKYQEAFVTLPNGQRTWNNDSRLPQAIGQYMQDPRLSSSPDGLAIASKLAYADLLESGEITAQKKLASIKRQNQVLKNKVMPEGGGVPVVAKTKDPYSEAVNRLRTSGRKEDAQAAISAYLSGVLNKG